MRHNLLDKWRIINKPYVTLENKTSHKGQFYEIEILIHNLSIDAWFVMIGQYLKGCKKNSILRKSSLKVFK